MEKFLIWDEIPGDYTKGREPSVTYYPTPRKISRAVAVIFPGGGYSGLAPHEGYGYANLINMLGMDAFVVESRVNPHRFPSPLIDARRAVRYVRANAEKFDIDKDKVFVMGSSAGGHLASLLCTYREELPFESRDEVDKEDYLPNAQVLAYPVISMHDENVTHLGSNQNLLGENWRELAPSVSPDLIADEKTPPAFIWHTYDDGAVNVLNSLNLATRLKNVGVPMTLHIYPKGWHGMGVATHNYCASEWTQELKRWLVMLGYIAIDTMLY